MPLTILTLEEMQLKMSQANVHYSLYPHNFDYKRNATDPLKMSQPNEHYSLYTHSFDLRRNTTFIIPIA